MLDIKFIRENPELVKQGAQKKGVKVDIDRILELDKKQREVLGEIEGLRAERNKITKQVAKEKTPSLIKKAQQIKQEISKKEMTLNEFEKKGRKIKQELKEQEVRLKQARDSFEDLMLLVPMPPAADVPEGKTEKDNLEVRTWGKKPQFNFGLRDYLSLMKDLDLLDLERGAKIGGFRQYMIKNEAVLLEQALLRFSLDVLAKKGFILFRPTSMVRESAMFGTGMFPSGREETYQADEDLFLSGTTEVPLMAYYGNEILEEKDLPLKMAGLSVAFRKEVGSYGRDVKGIFRVHEFWQTEQIILCKNSEEETIKQHEWLLNNSEEIMQALKIPYRVINVCAGDLAPGQVKRYDIEAWVPSQSAYRETHSDSYLFDFQARRLNLRYKAKDGTLKFVHSLNNTAIAVPRILISLLENYQQKDGSITVPKVLQKYVGFKKIVPKQKK